MSGSARQGYAGRVSVPESRPPRLTDAERQQLEELERRLVGQFPDLDHRFRNTAGAGHAAPAEVRLARAVFAVVALIMVIVAAAVGGAEVRWPCC